MPVDPNHQPVKYQEEGTKCTNFQISIYLYVEHNYPFSYGTPIRIQGIVSVHTHTGYPTRIWDVPYAYGPLYAYA